MHRSLKQFAPSISVIVVRNLVGNDVLRAEVIKASISKVQHTILESYQISICHCRLFPHQEIEIGENFLALTLAQRRNMLNHGRFYVFITVFIYAVTINMQLTIEFDDIRYPSQIMCELIEQERSTAIKEGGLVECSIPQNNRKFILRK